MLSQVYLWAKAIQLSNAEYTLPDPQPGDEYSGSDNNVILLIGGLALAKYGGWI